MTRAICLIAILAAAVLPANAQTEADFYRGKTVSIGIPSDVGGGYDAHGRLLARHLGKHLQGNPTVIAQNLTAGAGLVLANNLFNTAARDGTAIGIVRASVLYEEIFGNRAVRFKGLGFNWIGNMNSAQDSCVFWSSAGVKEPADFYAREHVVGADGVAGMDYSFPRVYNELLGTKFKIVTGYKGTPERVLAMERGEIEGACGLTTGNVKAVLGRQYREGKLRVVAQAGLTRDPDFPDVPNMFDQAKSPEQRAALQFIFAQLELSRPVAAPPELSEARVATLRAAFDAATNDPAFREEAKRLTLDITPIGGASTASIVQRFFASPRPVIERVRAALGQGGN